MTTLTTNTTATALVPQMDELDIIWASLSEEDKATAIAVALQWWGTQSAPIKGWTFPCGHEARPGEWVFKVRAEMSTLPIGWVDFSPILGRYYFNK